MARKKPNLPAQGAAFAFPVGDGRFSVCRVLLDATSEGSRRWGTDSILVAASRWIGDTIPRADDPALRPLLHLTHHSWDNKPYILWISEEPPKEFIPIGTIEPTAEERAIQCMRFGNWGCVAIQPLMQWRWDHDREAVLAEDLIKQKADQEVRLQQRREREQYLARVTLDELRKHRFFEDWKSYPPRKAILASRKVMSETVEKLLELGPHASEKARLTILQRCIESFNELDAEMRFIETVEREDICEEFEAIAHACGLGAEKDLADRWREW